MWCRLFLARPAGRSQPRKAHTLLQHTNTNAASIFPKDGFLCSFSERKAI